MTTADTPAVTAHPKIVSRREWLAARLELLAKEKELTRARDALSAQRRRLPMVRLDKPYTFEGPCGRASLLDLFEGRPQLVVYHFMFDPDGPPPGKSGAPWEEGCPGCSFLADHIPTLAHLHARGTSLAVVSHAPLAKIEPFKRRMGWTFPWYSSFGSEFNYDFHVTVDDAQGSSEWNYASVAGQAKAGKVEYVKGELPGLSTFLRVGDEVFHAYSTYARGLESLLTTYHILDLTPFGRQEAWEDSPDGWPRSTSQGAGWLRHHDRYETAAKAPCPCCRAADTQS